MERGQQSWDKYLFDCIEAYASFFDPKIGKAYWRSLLYKFRSWNGRKDLEYFNNIFRNLFDNSIWLYYDNKLNFGAYLFIHDNIGKIIIFYEHWSSCFISNLFLSWFVLHFFPFSSILSILKHTVEKLKLSDSPNHKQPVNLFYAIYQSLKTFCTLRESHSLSTFLFLSYTHMNSHKSICSHMMLHLYIIDRFLLFMSICWSGF